MKSAGGAGWGAVLPELPGTIRPKLQGWGELLEPPEEVGLLVSKEPS